MTRFAKVLIANRGEIAVRIARTLRTLEIPSVVAHHATDADSLACREADEAYEIAGNPPSAAYLDVTAIVAACRATGADAVHPGYGFLSENAAFARAVEAAGIRFIGPSPEAIELMGDKVRARRFVAEGGFPVLEAADEEDAPETFARRAAAIGFPLLIKAAAGGGGRGMRIVGDAAELEAQLSIAKGEAARYFGDGRLYCERYVERSRHIEVQVLGDAEGHVVHFGERECSIQRRFQKIVEEAPAPGIGEELRGRLCEAAVGIARAMGYTNAGTVEFILAPDGAFYFLEMNTRLQVEHPVTEAVTGFDLVREQVRIAAGEALGYGQEAIGRQGHAVECRIYAEEPEAEFTPAVGEVLLFNPPSGPGIRFDSGVTAGQRVTAAFDPLLAKLIAHGATRAEALERARTALRELVLLGVATNAAYLERVLGHPDFRSGAVSTHFLTDHAEALALPPPTEEEQALLVAAAALTQGAAPPAAPALYAAMGSWRN
ncbi:MAG: ATP-grasp domain-containing protein [SAR324 cluster bacterium]|nr:ATP-grasp domain-containing protein [SAR324 cluster bacterium]